MGLAVFSAQLKNVKLFSLRDHFSRLRTCFRETTMSITHRILICVGILLLDLIVFFLPLSAFFLVYILLVNPLWFRQYLQEIDKGNPVK
jgi:hypothetical protein